MTSKEIFSRVIVNEVRCTYAKMKNEAAMKKLNATAAHILRTLRSFGGIIAFSLFQNCKKIKMAIRMPNTTNRAMIRPSDHAYVVPPH